MISTQHDDFWKKIFGAAVIWHLVKYFFRYPMRFTVVIVLLYLGGRYVLFNRPDLIHSGIDAVKAEAHAVGQQIKTVANERNQANGRDPR
jgi:hypothetical protein